MRFHGPPEGVLLQGVPGDGFVNVPELADGEPWAQEVLGVGAVGIPPPQFLPGGGHDVGVVVGQWPWPRDWGQPDPARVSEQCILQCGIRDDGQVCHGQHPSTFVTVRVVEDGKLGWVATGDAGLLGQGAGDGVGESFALV